MIRGVYFEIQQTTYSDLWQILKCIEIEKYNWYNIDSQNEVRHPPFGELFFKTDYYDGKSFSQLIHSNHYIIFLKLQAYFPNGEQFDIHTYEEFQKSDCQLLLLIADSVFVYIYAKDQNLIKSIFDNASINKYTAVKYITESNDSRTKMDVV